MNERKRVIDLTWRMARRSISSEFKGTALGRALVVYQPAGHHRGFLGDFRLGFPWRGGAW